MRIIYSLLLLLSASSITAQQPLKLWYSQPSGSVWENALPIGNGRLGAMVYGNVEKEIIQLNEHTVWSGSPNRNDNPDALASLPEIRRLVFEGKQKEAEQLAAQTIQSKKSNGQMFQPVGGLNLLFRGHETYNHYYRELDIARAVAKTSYISGGVQYTREVFASIPDQLIVMRLTADKPGSISFTAGFSTPQPRAVISTNKSKELIIAGTTKDHEGVKGMIRFKGIVRFRTEGGNTVTGDTSITIQHANAVTICISIATNYVNYHDISADENKRVAAYLDKSSGKLYPDMLKAHITAYQKFFDRVKIDLGTNAAAALPTDERLRNFRSQNDPQLVALYYQYGRYLLISSSQPGGQPANLQGIWNDKIAPPWDSKYTININTEMNYWPAEKTNLPEMHLPLFQMVKEIAETGKETARVMYGARGWVTHHNTDIWRITGPVDRIFWGIWSAGGAWLSQHLWEHYLYSGDETFLADAYPILKGAAMFYVDDLVEHPKYHWLVVNPGTSPENAPKAHGGSSIDAGTTMDNQIVFDVFSTAIRAAAILKKDKAFADTLVQMRKRLPPMHIGQHGQLQEWLDDIDDPNDKHRHISHLYGLFPSNQISPYRTPALYSAAKNTLLQRGDVSTGWSMGWKINWWARMHDGNHAYQLIQNQLTPLGSNKDGGGTYNNLFDAHPPFQIDGNFGCTSGITEMLVQSADGFVELLPALPDAWPSGTISGIRLRGGFVIKEMQWENGQVKSVKIQSTLGGNLRLRTAVALKVNNGSSPATANDANKNPFYQTEETAAPVISSKAVINEPALKAVFVYDIPTKKGGEYILMQR